jgi:TRIAD3 protein (E3 ubiquitin-protein ligase RNF216)
VPGQAQCTVVNKGLFDLRWRYLRSYIYRIGAYGAVPDFAPPLGYASPVQGTSYSTLSPILVISAGLPRTIMADTLGSSSPRMEGVIDISPSPELQPQTVYRPLPRKRPLFLPDGDDSAIELTDSTDSQSSAPCKRVKRRAHSRQGRNAVSSGSGVRSQALRWRAFPQFLSTRLTSSYCRPPVTDRAQRPRAKSPRLPISPIFPAVQEPHAHPASIGGGSMQIMPLADPGSHQLPYNEPTPPLGLVPLVREPSPPVATLVSRVEQQPHEVLVERVREVVPDVLPAHVFNLLNQHKAAISDNILDLVIHTLLEDPSYPKDLKGKGKARAAKDNPSEIPGDVNTSVDYAILDANRSRGPVYRALCLVRLGASLPRCSLTLWGSEISS